MNVGNVKGFKGAKSGKDVVLSSANGNLSPKCYKCEKAGHKAVQCSAVQREVWRVESRPSSLITVTCVVKLDTRRLMWGLAANVDRRPKNYKPKSQESSDEAGAYSD